MSSGCPNRSTVSHIIISSHRLTGFSTLCLAATSSRAERIPLGYPKHLTRKRGVRRTFLKNNSWMVQWANSTSNRDTQTRSCLRDIRSISCACPWCSESPFLICAPSFTVLGEMWSRAWSGGLPWGRLHCLTPKECYSGSGGEWDQGERDRVQSEM